MRGRPWKISSLTHSLPAKAAKAAKAYLQSLFTVSRGLISLNLTVKGHHTPNNVGALLLHRGDLSDAHDEILLPPSQLPAHHDTMRMMLTCIYLAGKV